MRYLCSSALNFPGVPLKLSSVSVQSTDSEQEVQELKFKAKDKADTNTSQTS